MRPAAPSGTLRRLTGAALYVSALTREDWRTNCDRSRTDRAVHLRSGQWYRRRLRKRFNYLGFGVWLRKDVTAILWDLETARAAALNAYRFSSIQADQRGMHRVAGAEIRAHVVDQ